MKKIWKVLLCVAIIASMLLTSVAMAASTDSEVPHGSLQLTTIENARDIGGYKTQDGSEIKEGLLFRSANLHDASDEELNKLADIGVSKVIDLRMNYEKLLKPNKSVPGAAYIKLSPLSIPNFLVLKADDWGAIFGAIRSGVMEVYMANMYRQLVQDPTAKRETKKFFDEILESAKKGEPVLWHCTAGKDRTGVAAALLMGALGCDEETIIKEYLVTQQFYAEKAQESYDKVMKVLPIKALAKEFYQYETVDENWIGYALNIIERSGGMQKYLESEIGLTTDDINSLKEAYLEEPVSDETPSENVPEEQIANTLALTA